VHVAIDKFCIRTQITSNFQTYGTMRKKWSCIHSYSNLVSIILICNSSMEKKSVINEKKIEQTCVLQCLDA
jgi:hypothetical protein